MTVTVLMPSMTETNFRNRAAMMDTYADQAWWDDPADMAEALMER